jgi:hypothetical protein
VLSDDVGVHMLRIHLQIPPQQGTEAGGVERSPRPEDPRARNSQRSGVFGRHMGHHVHGIGYHQEHRVGGVLQHVGHDFGDDRGVADQEVHPRFARLLRGARGDDHDPAGGQIGILPGPHLKRVGEGDRVEDVIRLGLRALGV